MAQKRKQDPNKNLSAVVQKGSGTSREDIERGYWEAADKYPGPAFTRGGLSEFLGGTPSPGRLANMDSEGVGPDGGFYDGRTKKYLKVPAVKWALSRLEV